MRQKNNQNRIKVYRTMEGNIFEAVTAVILIVIWTIALTRLKSMDEPVTFLSDEENNASTRMIAGSIVATVLSLLFLVSAYFPDRMINMRIDVKNTAQYALMIRMSRIMAVETAVIYLGSIANVGNDRSIYPALLAIALSVTLMIFRTLIKRKG